MIRTKQGSECNNPTMFMDINLLIVVSAYGGGRKSDSISAENCRYDLVGITSQGTLNSGAYAQTSSHATNYKCNRVSPTGKTWSDLLMETMVIHCKRYYFEQYFCLVVRYKYINILNEVFAFSCFKRGHHRAFCGTYA